MFEKNSGGHSIDFFPPIRLHSQKSFFFLFLMFRIFIEEEKLN